jgi:hypothetical protein
MHGKSKILRFKCLGFKIIGHMDNKCTVHSAEHKGKHDLCISASAA